MIVFSWEITRIITLFILSFILAFALSPFIIHFFRSRNIGKQIRDAKETPIVAKLHENKRGTPTMAGVVIWLSVLVLSLIFYFSGSAFNFLTRSQTLLPLGVLIASALVGLVDDWFNLKKMGAHGGGLRARHRLIIYTLIAISGALWFYFKLDWDVIRIPFVGDYYIGWLMIPVFVLVIVSTSFSVNETDGLDGLAGGTLLSAFFAFGIIAFLQGKYDLAAFCTVIVGALFAFMWFNIYPASYIMGDTGAMSLGVTLGVVALLCNAFLLLPVIGLVLVLESLSVILQIFWRKVFKKKLFLSAPFHHHLEAKGYKEPNIVMRLWIISMQFAGLGVILFLLDQFF